MKKLKAMATVNEMASMKVSEKTKTRMKVKVKSKSCEISRERAVGHGSLQLGDSPKYLRSVAWRNEGEFQG